MTASTGKLHTWSVAAEPVDGPDGARLLRAYIADVVGRYHGRSTTDDEIDEAMAEDPSESLSPPTGMFLVARSGVDPAQPASPGRDRGEPAGCVGVRLIGDRIAELKRMYVRPARRGAGCGHALIDAAEQAARDLGARLIRLDTRHDLVEARALYASHGYVEIPAYNDSPYAQHWFEKRLA